jgi:hypothetical protein
MFGGDAKVYVCWLGPENFETAQHSFMPEELISEFVRQVAVSRDVQVRSHHEVDDVLLELYPGRPAPMRQIAAFGNGHELLFRVVFAVNTQASSMVQIAKEGGYHYQFLVDDYESYMSCLQSEFAWQLDTATEWINLPSLMFLPTTEHRFKRESKRKCCFVQCT